MEAHFSQSNADFPSKAAAEKAGRESSMAKSLAEERISKPGGGCAAANLFLGLSWPPRSYTCSFCKREFRSAQALGGHMNVHRRDRARLRESPPWEPPTKIEHPANPNPKRNPNRLLLLNLNSDPEGMPEAFSSELQPSKNRIILRAVEEVSETKDSTIKALKRKNGARGLQLETGMNTTVSDNLDLDLRLGYP